MKNETELLGLVSVSLWWINVGLIVFYMTKAFIEGHPIWFGFAIYHFVICATVANILGDLNYTK